MSKAWGPVSALMNDCADIRIEPVAAPIDKVRPLIAERDRNERPDLFHRLVRTHPGSRRRSLYGRWARDVEEMDPDEGSALFEELFEDASRDRFVYRHKWRVHDAVLWDNRCMLRTAAPFDEQRHTRLTHRPALEGEEPVSIRLWPWQGTPPTRVSARYLYKDVI